MWKAEPKQQRVGLIAKAYRQLIFAVYERFNPEKANDDLLALFEKYTGREARLFDVVCRKYVFGREESEWVPLIEHIYAKFNPDMLERLEELLWKYRGNEADLYRSACDKYIPSILACDLPLKLGEFEAPPSYLGPVRGGPTGSSSVEQQHSEEHHRSHEEFSEDASLFEDKRFVGRRRKVSGSLIDMADYWEPAAHLYKAYSNPSIGFEPSFDASSRSWMSQSGLSPLSSRASSPRWIRKKSLMRRKKQLYH